MVVIRLKNDGSYGNSRPCWRCLQMMKQLNVNKIYYSSGEDNKFITESVKDMISIQDSISSRFYSGISNDYESKVKYYTGLLKKNFPERIKKDNLEIFIKFNFNNVLPDATCITYKKKKKLLVSIWINGSLIITSEVI